MGSLKLAIQRSGKCNTYYYILIIVGTANDVFSAKGRLHSKIVFRSSIKVGFVTIKTALKFGDEVDTIFPEYFLLTYVYRLYRIKSRLQG